MIDTHVHLADERYNDPGAVIARAGTAGVKALIGVAAAFRDWPVLARIARDHPQVRLAMGLHPWHAGQWTPEKMAELEALAARAPVVAIGEIGLDFGPDRPDETIQTNCCSSQLDLARRINRPVVLHIFKAWPEMLQLIKTEGLPEKGGVWHGFSGSRELAREALDAGLHISFGGALTYGKNRKCRETAATVPTERMLVESDGPDFPVCRIREQADENDAGLISRPEHVRDVYQTLADLRGVGIEAVVSAVAANARELFEE